MTVVESAGGAFLAGTAEGGGLWTAYLPVDVLTLLGRLRRERGYDLEGPGS